MKILPLVLALFVCLDCFGNEIDKLQSNHDVNNFLIRKVDKRFTVMPLSEDYRVTTAAGYGRDKFFKVDIDKNGLTDLVVYGFRSFFIVFDNGNKKYTVHHLERDNLSSAPMSLVFIDSLSAPRKIIVQRSAGSKERFDTLVYKFNGILEYNSKPAADLLFRQINFATERCFGTCPVFEMTINKDRTASYKAIHYNDKTGDYKGTIPANELDELIALLQYIQLDKLKNEYAVDWTDDQTVITTIAYNGKTKVIRDYGKQGTFGLSLLYAKLFSLRKLVDWTKQ